MHRFYNLINFDGFHMLHIFYTFECIYTGPPNYKSTVKIHVIKFLSLISLRNLSQTQKFEHFVSWFIFDKDMGKHFWQVTWGLIQPPLKQFCS